VIIVAGTNDISNGFRENLVNEYDIVNNILNIARKAKIVGTRKIFVSSILPRFGQRYHNVITRINNLLESTCREEGFNFLNHSEVTSKHICMDGIHPNVYGNLILRMNILECFNSFNPYLCSFYSSYENALV
jgi:lysophospholipase L1-like esterase